MSTGTATAQSTEDALVLALVHDLRRHLRTSVTRARMIERDSDPPLSQRSKEHVEELLSAGRKMDFLLTRIVQYAVAGTSDEEFLRGDPALMFDSALRRLTDRNKDVDIDSIAIKDCGVTAPYGVETVLRELLDNALKFRQGPVKITVLIEQSEGNLVFGIRDTGIGFDPQYREKIMLPLERLHPPDDAYGGCGLGLAICKRTLEGLGGRLWAESKISSGSTFWFSLPA